MHIEYLKKDILQTGKRHINYLTLQFELYKQRDAQIDKMEIKLKLMLGDKAMLQKHRDESFKNLLDLNVERRKMLMALGSYTDVIGMAYSSKVEQNQPRLEMHQAIENQI